MVGKLVLYERLQHPCEDTCDSSIPEKLGNLSPRWRSMLTPTHQEPFVWRGFRWISILHALYGTQRGFQSIEQRNRFTMDEGDPLGIGGYPPSLATKHFPPLTPTQRNQWELTKEALLEEITHAKFLQTGLAKEVLRQTAPAELWWYWEKKLVRYTALEAIRADMLP